MFLAGPRYVDWLFPVSATTHCKTKTDPNIFYNQIYVHEKCTYPESGLLVCREEPQNFQLHKRCIDILADAPIRTPIHTSDIPHP
jgi:hypothetical protein